jgi:hypothetical protein
MKTVTEPALVRRINRKIQGSGDAVRACAYGSSRFLKLGRYYAVDVSTNCIIQYDVDLEQFGRQVGALKENEALAE